MLTGKCAIDFKVWLFEFYKNPLSKSNVTAKLQTLSFPNNKFAGRYGIYLLFFDTVQFNIEIIKSRQFFCPYVNNQYALWQDTKEQARYEAILKADKLYNEKSY